MTDEGRPSAVGILGPLKARQLREGGYAAVPRKLVEEILETGNDVLNGDADLSELDDLLALLHHESA